MDYNKKKKEILKETYPLGGMLIIGGLGIFGLVILYLSGIFSITDYKSFYEVISKNGVPVIFSLFFVILFLYILNSYISFIFAKPKERVLYLTKDEDDDLVFLNRKGKKINYWFRDKSIESDKNYKVVMINDSILEIVGPASEEWKVEPKRSYWLNYYSPVGNFEDMFMLPIVYVIELPGLLEIIMAPGYQKLIGVIWSIIPMYAIIYDFIYKLRFNKNNPIYISESKMIETYGILNYLIVIIVIIAMIGFTIYLSFLINNIIFRMFFGLMVVILLFRIKDVIKEIRNKD